MFQGRFRSDLITVIAVFMICAILTLVEFSIEAFTDRDVLGLMVFAVPFIVCACIWLRAKSTRDTHTPLAFTVGILLAQITLNILGGDRVEATILRARVGMSKDYARRCDVAEDIPVDGGKLRVCEKRWHMSDELTAVVKFEGDTRKLIDGEFSKSNNWTRVNLFLPFGVMNYRATRISGDFYLLNFTSDDG